MLRRENELRLTPQVQEAYARTHGGGKVTIDVQKQVAEEFGFPDVEVGIELLRTAEARFPDDPEIKQLSHYRKYNRAKQGDLNTGDVAPDVRVYNMDGQAVQLFAFAGRQSEQREIEPVIKRARVGGGEEGAVAAPVIADSKPVVLIAGSYS
jgi:hypothetical protein